MPALSIRSTHDVRPDNRRSHGSIVETTTLSDGSGPRFAARASATSSAWTWRPVSRLNPRPRTRPVGDTTSAPTENAVGDGTQRRARATACPIHRARLRADGRAGAVALFLL